MFLTVYFRIQISKFLAISWHITCRGSFRSAAFSLPDRYRLESTVSMRIVEYNGHAVKRQRKLADGQILITFYDQAPVAVTPQDWRANSKSVYFDSPNVRRRDVVRQPALAAR